MAMVKMNVFHWHITDSHSFPIIIRSHPYLHRYGAYAANKVYTAANVADIVRYAYVRGVHVLPELDVLAHGGEGWQFTNLTTCYKSQPWPDYCRVPPCGQLDPTQDRLYDVLGDVYGELMQMFGQPEWFHMGGDDVNSTCWETSQSIQDWMKQMGWNNFSADYMELRGHFQQRALDVLDARSQRPPAKIVLKTSKLTTNPWLKKYIDSTRYVVYAWSSLKDHLTKFDIRIEQLMKEGYNLIFAFHDVLHLDCGLGSWVSRDENWCSPYHAWTKIYELDLKEIAGEHQKQIVGAAVVLGSEISDEQSIDSRIWPRAVALAERLWSDPSTKYRQAEPRILLQRERMVENGIRADALQPEWCVQNEGFCPKE